VVPLDNKRSIVESIVEKVTIGKDEIDLTLSYLPSSDELVKCQQELRTTQAQLSLSGPPKCLGACSGDAQYPPGLMLALLTSSYATGTFSSRAMERSST
jgi:hypothetical protein